MSELSSYVNREVGLALILYPIFLPSLISHTVSVDVMHHKRIRVRHFIHPRENGEGGDEYGA